MNNTDWLDEILGELQQSTIIIHSIGSVKGVEEDARAFYQAKNDAKKAILNHIDKANTVTGETSDGYHTFNELYEYRLVYNALYANEFAKRQPLAVNKSKRHADGELCFGGGWFVVTMFLPTGQVTNHYELKDWDKFHCDELDTAPEWDGHTPQEALHRLRQQLGIKEGE